MRKTFIPLVVILFVVLAAAFSAQAQNTPALASDAQPVAMARATTPSVSTLSPASQAIVNSLASLPEADSLIYVNTQRILNEALPRFMPAKELEGMRKAIEDIKRTAGFDPTKVDYMVLAVRFRKPTADLNFQAPEFMMVTSGDFSAEALLGLARVAAQGKLRDEKYADKTLSLMTIDPMVKEAEKNPFLKAFTEVGIVSLNGNTLAVGSPGYLRAAIDAGGGKDRISTESLNSLVRDPNVLMSFAGSPWGSFAKSFGMLGTETTPRAARCDSKIGDIYAALTMDATNFSIRGVSNADNPDTAKIFANLYFGFLKYAVSSTKDPAAQSFLKGIAITAEGDEVLLNANFPQQMVIDFIQKQMMKPKQADSTGTKPDVKKVTKPTAGKRRGRRGR